MSLIWKKCGVWDMFDWTQAWLKGQQVMFFNWIRIKNIILTDKFLNETGNLLG